jgi:hypothetical protein
VGWIFPDRNDALQGNAEIHGEIVYIAKVYIPVITEECGRKTGLPGRQRAGTGGFATA